MIKIEDSPLKNQADGQLKDNPKKDMTKRYSKISEIPFLVV